MRKPIGTVDELSTAWIASMYGGVVQAKDVSRLLSFSNPAALRRAHTTGRLPIRLFQLKGRRGWFAHAAEISAYLRAHSTPFAGEKFDDMT